MPTAPVQRSKSFRPVKPSLKLRLNEPTKSTGTKKRRASMEITSNEEGPKPAKVQRFTASTPTLMKYLLTARTDVGIQTVYRETESVTLGVWSAKRYFDESTIRIQKAANQRAIDPVFQSSTATIYNKSMKPSEYLTCDVNEWNEWRKVEDIVEHLSQSQSKSIRVDLIIKYDAKQLTMDDSEVEVVDVMELAENETSSGKRVRQVVRARKCLLTFRLLRTFYWRKCRSERKLEDLLSSLNSFDEPNVS